MKELIEDKPLGFILFGLEGEFSPVNKKMGNRDSQNQGPKPEIPKKQHGQSAVNQDMEV
jgi:hypothetical protein